jgi:hypothetical protein
VSDKLSVEDLVAMCVIYNGAQVSVAVGVVSQVDSAWAARQLAD